MALKKAGEDPPDVILLDIMMPNLDGFEVCRRLTANPETARIPVLMITGLEERDARKEGIAAGAYDFFSKPVDVQQVLLRVSNAVYAKLLLDEVMANQQRLHELSEIRQKQQDILMRRRPAPLT